MKEPFIPLLNSYPLNTKAGFKLIYNAMLSTNDFSKAIKMIFGIREINISTTENIIATFKCRYKKEKHDYVHAILNNNNINN